MARYVSIIGFSLLLVVWFTAPARSQQPGQVAPDATQGPAAAAEPGVSIFNDQLRRFKFLLEHEVATLDMVEEFLVNYRRPENPPILGAYPDTHTNALVVIGPPEAEQAIRECLARRMVEANGIKGAPPLAMQLRILQHERTERLEILADMEVEELAAAAAENGPSKAKQIAARRQILEDELKITEQQIRIVRKYMARAEADESAPVAAAGRD